MAPPIARRLPESVVVLSILTLIGAACCWAAPILFIGDTNKPAVPNYLGPLLAVVFFIISVVLASKYGGEKVDGMFRRTPHHWVCFMIRMIILAGSLTLTSFFNVTVRGILGYCSVAVAVFCILMNAQLPFDGGLLQGVCVLPIQALRQYLAVSLCDHTQHHIDTATTTLCFVSMGIVSFLMLGCQHHYVAVYGKIRSKQQQQD